MLRGQPEDLLEQTRLRIAMAQTKPPFGGDRRYDDFSIASAMKLPPPRGDSSYGTFQPKEDGGLAVFE